MYAFYFINDGRHSLETFPENVDCSIVMHVMGNSKIYGIIKNIIPVN